MALATVTFRVVAGAAASALPFCPVFLARLAAQWCGQPWSWQQRQQQ